MVCVGVLFIAEIMLDALTRHGGILGCASSAARSPFRLMGWLGIASGKDSFYYSVIFLHCLVYFVKSPEEFCLRYGFGRIEPLFDVTSSSVKHWGYMS
ncbi:MAG: hypothetical protein ACLRWP_13325 [Bilophila wadsworthia]